MSDCFLKTKTAAVRLSSASLLDGKIRTVMDGVLKQIDMRALADYFRYTKDMFATGEFWGKLMRAACMIYSYTGDTELKKIIDAAAEDMLSLQREDGCISTCPASVQPRGTHGSDLWERKYVLMGLLAYYDATGDTAALEGARRLVVYTNSQVGNAPKTPVTETGWAFYGIESASILDPVMRVWQYTKEPAAWELGTYLVGSGCCKRENIFAGIRNGKAPKDIGGNGNPQESIAKAYEMTSCFEGLCEYYRATGDEELLALVRRYFAVVAEQEITLLGSGGADAPYNLGPGTGEQWNFTRYEQTNPAIDKMMETCVTVYWMRLCYQLLRLTGEGIYADALEVSLYNAIYGAIRPDGCFFEYFPRFNGARNPKVNYSHNINGFDLSCCTANGPSALGMATEFCFMQTADGGVVWNLYETGDYTYTHKGGSIAFSLVSDYPRTGNITLTVGGVTGDVPQDFSVRLRVPGFAEGFTADTGNCVYSGIAGQYLRIPCAGIRTGDTLRIAFAIPLVRVPAPHGSDRRGDAFAAFTYGSLLLARDERDGIAPLAPVTGAAVQSFRIGKSHFDGFLSAAVTLSDRTELTLCDYMSAGNAWDGGTFAAWLPTK